VSYRFLGVASVHAHLFAYRRKSFRQQLFKGADYGWDQGVEAVRDGTAQPKTLTTVCKTHFVNGTTARFRAPQAGAISPFSSRKRSGGRMKMNYENHEVRRSEKQDRR